MKVPPGFPLIKFWPNLDSLSQWGQRDFFQLFLVNAFTTKKITELRENRIIFFKVSRKESVFFFFLPLVTTFLIALGVTQLVSLHSLLLPLVTVTSRERRRTELSSPDNYYSHLLVPPYPSSTPRQFHILPLACAWYVQEERREKEEEEERKREGEEERRGEGFHSSSSFSAISVCAGGIKVEGNGSR